LKSFPSHMNISDLVESTKTKDRKDWKKQGRNAAIIQICYTRTKRR